MSKVSAMVQVRRSIVQWQRGYPIYKVRGDSHSGVVFRHARTTRKVLAWVPSLITLLGGLFHTLLAKFKVVHEMKNIIPAVVLLQQG